MSIEWATLWVVLGISVADVAIGVWRLRVMPRFGSTSESTLRGTAPRNQIQSEEETAICVATAMACAETTFAKGLDNGTRERTASQSSNRSAHGNAFQQVPNI